MDRITLEDALESDVWMMVYAGEPEREISVEMRYADLVAIRKLIVRYCDEQSKADLINPIRCKDCKFSKAYYHGSESNLGMFTYLCTQGLYGMNPDDYCSRAERKEE